MNGRQVIENGGLLLAMLITATPAGQALLGGDLKLPPQEEISPAVRAARYCVNHGVYAGIPIDATPRQARETISNFRWCQYWAQVQGLGE